MAQCVTPPAPAVSPTVQRINNPLSNQQVTGVGAGGGAFWWLQFEGYVLKFNQLEKLEAAKAA